MGQLHDTRFGSSAESEALAGAVRQCPAAKKRLATEMGVHPKTLRRWVNAEARMTVVQWSNAIRQCGLEPSSSLLLAENGLGRLIGSSYQAYVDKFMKQLFDAIHSEDNIILDPRSATRDASMIRDAWMADTHRREEYLAEISIEGAPRQRR